MIEDLFGNLRRSLIGVIPSALALLMFTACGNKTTANVAKSDTITADSVADTVTSTNKQNTDAAKAVVEAAYKSYFNPSKAELKEQEEAEINLFNLSYMYKYVTDELNEKIVMAYDKQNATDDLFLDYDIWINAQDWDGLKLKQVKIIDSSADKATAEVSFINFNEQQKAYVVVTRNNETGKWLISDFLSPDDKSSFVKQLDDYLAE